MFATRDGRHPGLQAIIETNLGAAQEMLSDVAFPVEFSSTSDKLAFEAVDLKPLFSEFSICVAKREFPHYCLAPLFGLKSRAAAKKVAQYLRRQV